MVKFVSLAINTVMKPRQKRQNPYTRQRITTKKLMPDQRISYRVNPLPQSEVPQHPSKPVPSVEPPENLYKPPSTRTRQPFQPASTTVSSASATVNPISSPVTPFGPAPDPKPTRGNSIAPSRPAPESNRLQHSEAQTIARHMLKNSDSARLEQLLRRQESKRYQPSQKPSPSLEQLAVVRRPDQRYQIVLRFNQQPITHQVFRTLKHCAEAAAELEQKFELGIVASGETAEAVNAIVRAAVARESVELQCAVA